MLSVEIATEEYDGIDVQLEQDELVHSYNATVDIPVFPVIPDIVTENGIYYLFFNHNP